MKILVVEDEYKIAASIKRGLKQELFTVDLAYDGMEGYDLASSEKYDVIVLDLMLPGKDGILITEELRKEGNHTPILMLTAKGELHDKVKGFNSGADDYLVKPFAFEELLARIKALAKRPVKVANQRIEINGIKLNTRDMEVKVYGKIVDLSKKEYSILEYLMKNKGKLVSKEKIMTHVWDYESDILPNTVEVFIGSLRKKIGKNAIKTVKGFGYKMS